MVGPNKGVSKETPCSLPRRIYSHGAWVAGVFFGHLAQEIDGFAIKELTQANNPVVRKCFDFLLGDRPDRGVVHDVRPFCSRSSKIRCDTFKVSSPIGENPAQSANVHRD